MRLAWHVARMEDNRGAFRILVARCYRKKPLGTPRRRWEHNIKMVL